jgi:nitrogen-specific signal transduction histidine kinase
MNNEYLHQNGPLALAALPEAIILVDKNQVIRFVNPAAVRLFKISDVAAILQTSFSDFPGGSELMTYSQRVAYHNHINTVAVHKVPDPQPNDEQRWSIDIDNRFFNFRATPICDDQNQDCGFIISADEWSNERKASELLFSLLSDCLMPFHTIRGYSELLLREDPSSPLTKQQREFLTHINENTKRLLELRQTIVADYKKQLEGNK